ncbi:MAG: hypothetical protein ACKVXR_16285 [Planctomycetota bacterium]
MDFNQAYDPFRALQTSWRALKKAPLPLMIGGAVLIITNGGGGGGGNFGSSFDGREEVDWDVLGPLLVGFVGLFCCLGIVFFVISSWVRIGFANAVEEVLRTGEADVGKVFDGRGRLGSMILARLLAGVIVIASLLPYGIVILIAALATEGFGRNEELGVGIVLAGLVPCLPIILYVGLGVALSDQAVALEGLGPVDSVRRSWSLVKGHRWMLLWYSIVTGFFAMLGICACCIGVFLTGTMTEIAKSESFLAYTRGQERDGWWITTGSAPARAEPGWGSPTELPTKPVGWGAPPPPPPPPPPS